MLLPDDLIEVIATVEGHPVRGIVDTGAKSNIISRELCENLNLKTTNENPHVVLVTAGNEKLKPAATVSCNIQFGDGTPYRADLLVLENFRYGLLFGWRFLSKIGAKISFCDNKITIGSYECDLPDAFGVRNRNSVNCLVDDSEPDNNDELENPMHEIEPDNQHENNTSVRTALHEQQENSDGNDTTSSGSTGRDENTKSDEQQGCENNQTANGSAKTSESDTRKTYENIGNDMQSRENFDSDVSPRENAIVANNMNTCENVDDIVESDTRHERSKPESVTLRTQAGYLRQTPVKSAERDDRNGISAPADAVPRRNVVTPTTVKTSVEEGVSLLNLTTHLENSDEKIPKTSTDFSFTTDHRADDFKKTFRPFQILHVKERQQDSDLSLTACPAQDVCEGAVNFILDAERKGIISAGDFESILVIDEDVALGLEHEMSRFLEGPNWKTGGRSHVVLETNETKEHENTGAESDGADEHVNEHDNVQTDIVDLTEVVNQPENIRENKKTPAANIGSNLNAEQRHQYEILLSRFDEIMAKSAFDVGFAKDIEHHIDTGDHRPVFEPLRRMNPIETEELRKQVGILIQLGFVRESIGNPWAAPAVLVRKKNGTFRFCIDHRKLNAITKKDRTPLPRIDDVHDRLADSKFFTSLDFVSGYYHVPLEASSCEKTGFLTPFGLFEWTRMTMGLCNAPATFQRLMNRVLGPLMYKFCLAYLDDIVIYSKTFEEHLEHVDAVLSRIRDAGLKVQPAKSKFSADQLLYLGSNVSSTGISVDPAKIKSVEGFPVPKNQTMVRAFLGLTGYYRRFIFNYAKEAHPMIELTKTCAFRWGCEQQASFESLKLKLMTAPVLSFPDFTKPFFIHCDASNLGVGAILKQKDDENREKVIAYASRVLQPHERKYPVTHKECLAIIYAIDQFRYYVAMTKFFVVTDHHSLCYLMKVRKPYGRLTYWALMLQDFDFEITYKPGVSHRDADALSRYPVGYDEFEKTGDEIDYDVDARFMFAKTQIDPLPDMDAVASQRQQENTKTEKQCGNQLQRPENLLVTVSEQENQELHLHALQRQDGKWKKYIEFLMNPDATSTAVFRKKMRDFKLENGVLMKRVRNSESDLFLPVIPYPARLRILQQAHDDPMSGHLAGDRTWGRMRNRYFWPGIERDVRHYTESCDVCLRSNVTRRAAVGMMIPLRPTTQPFSRIGLDKMGPIHTSAKGHRYIYVVTDYCTKTVVTTAAKDGDSIASLGILSKVITTFGPPEEVVCDNGTEFMNEVVKTLMHENRIRLRPSAAYHPQTNGQTERANDTLSTMIRKYTDKFQRDWDMYLAKVTYAYNTSDHATTGMSPFFLFGFRFSPSDGDRSRSLLRDTVQRGLRFHEPGSPTDGAKMDCRGRR